MEHPICVVEEGQLKGQVDKDFQGRSFLSFMGVPYAKAPLGDLRFKPPQPPEKWDGIRDATKQGNSCSCLQMFTTEKGVTVSRPGSEDCLFLNIYTHEVLTDELKPVMVYIHGGGFVTGSADRSQYGPEFLMTEDIVLVTINYRLGALGFLSFDDPSLGVTGNAGLKDQVQALKWIQKNIIQFGGDANNVTIFGESAGGASVHYLVLSPLATGLFHKGILQSGCGLCPWARGINDAKQLAEKMGCTEASDGKILQFLQQAPVDKILEAQNELGDWLSSDVKRHFSPSVEVKAKGVLLPEDPFDLMTSGDYNHVPLLIGYTSREGFIDAWIEQFGFKANWQDLLPYHFGYSKDSQEYKEINRKISQFYFGRDTPDTNDKDTFYKLFTDTTFLRAIYLTTTIHAKTSREPVYFYRMSVETELNVFKKMAKVDSKGVSHGDDIYYFFKSSVEVKKGSSEELAVLRFVKMWTNFAKTGKPIPDKTPLLNVEWKPVTPNQLNFLDIDRELVPGIEPDIDRMKFWEELSKGVKMRY